MNNNKNKPDQTGGMEIERTHEMYEKGGPAPGTRDAGQEGKDYVNHDNADHDQSGRDSARSDKGSFY